MRIRESGWGVFLAVLPFSPFIFRPNLDLWHSQTIWAQGCVFMLLALSYMQAQHREPVNRPLALWIGWVALSTLYIWAQTVITKGVYPVQILPGLLHMLILLFFYQVAVKTLDSWSIEQIFQWVCWSGLLMMAYCAVQYLGLDQFFDDLEVGSRSHNIVGSIGNPTHLGTYMALLTPMYLMQKRWRWKLAAVASTFIVFWTFSAGAIIGLACGLLIYGWLSYKKYRWMLLSITVLGIIAMFQVRPDLIALNGRLEPWQQFYRFFEAKPITGFGAGFIYEQSKLNTLEIMNNWRHVHNEYFQMAIEHGLIGLGIIFY